MVNRDIEFLTNLKKRIDHSVIQLAKLEGQEETLLEELGDKFGCNTIEEAEKLVLQLENDLNEKNNELKEKVTELREKCL